MRVCKPPLGYSTPNRAHIDMIMQYYGLYFKYDYDLVIDLYSAFCYLFMGASPALAVDVKFDYDPYVEKYVKMIKKLTRSSATGNTPLTKALMFYQSLVNVNALSEGVTVDHYDNKEVDEAGDDGNDPRETEDNWTIIRDEDISSNEVKDVVIINFTINEKDLVDAITDMILDMENERMKDATTLYIGSFDRRAELPSEIIIRDMQEHKSFLDALTFVTKIPEIAGVKKMKKTMIVPIIEVSDLPNLIDPTALLDQNKLFVDLFNNQLFQIATEVPAKQAMIILLDTSQSMTEQWKADMTYSIIMDRMAYVAKGTAVLYIIPYRETIKLNEMVYVTTENINEVKEKRFNNITSCTDIESAIMVVSKEIDENRIGKFPYVGDNNPQIIIIADGDDGVTNKFTPPITTHAFLLGVNNRSIATMCHRSGGTTKTLLNN